MNDTRITACALLGLLASAVLAQDGTQPPSKTPRSAAAAAPTARPAQPTSLLVESRDNTFLLPWVNLDNVRECAQEINRRGISRIELNRIAPTRTQATVLRTLTSSCSGLTAISLTHLTFSADDLRKLLSDLPKLESLTLSSCQLTGDPDSIGSPKWIAIRSRLRRLSIGHCRNIDNGAVARLLALMPALEEVHLADNKDVTGEVFDGKGWPLRSLTRLKKFSLACGVNDAFVKRLLTEIPSLRALELWDCLAVRCVGWSAAHLRKLESLALIRCENATADAVSAMLKHAGRLRTFRLHRYQKRSAGSFDLTPLTNLRHLSVRGTGCRLRAVERLVNLQSLSMLHASSVDARDFDLSRLVELKQLALDGGRIDPRSLPSSLEQLQIHNARCGNSSVAVLLSRLTRLRRLTLTAIYGGRAYRTDPDAVTGEGWDFTGLKDLRQLDLGFCRYLNDRLVARIAEQLPNLESLRFAGSLALSGSGWDLSRLEKLKHLDLEDLAQLRNATLIQLPKSLESLTIRNCSQVTGHSWDLAALPKLAELEIQRCALTSLGSRLPASLKRLAVRECFQFQANRLAIADAEQLESLSFWECHQLDVDRLFAQLPKHAVALRRLDLTACPNPSAGVWDLSPLRHVLREVIYPEGEPSYVGGIDDTNFRVLKEQLPHTRIVR